MHNIDNWLDFLACVTPEQQFSIEMIAAIEIGLAAGHYYCDDLTPFVFKALNFDGNQCILAKTVDINVNEEDFVKKVAALKEQLNDEVRDMPRFSYILLRIQQKDKKFHHKTFVSDSFGFRDPSSNGGEYSQEPLALDVVTRFGNFEIYECRQEMELYARATGQILSVAPANRPIQVTAAAPAAKKTRTTKKTTTAKAKTTTATKTTKPTATKPPALQTTKLIQCELCY